jgi:hypothetical protein
MRYTETAKIAFGKYMYLLISSHIDMVHHLISESFPALFCVSALIWFLSQVL